MRTRTIFILSTVCTVISAIGALFCKQPDMMLVVAIMSFPIWLVTFFLFTRRVEGHVNILENQNYSNISRIRYNTEKKP